MVMLKYFLYLYLCIVFPKFTDSSLPPLGSSGAKKLDDCKACRVLGDSFNHWLEKTSRGKFEGGDADWEETKLKSYARSEVRLVEIQEGICSELKSNKDDCYALYGEAEELLEQWWNREDSLSSDLHTWLCIEQLTYCCPKQHFGNDCLPCLKGKNGEICSGNGVCDGEESRKGTGKCKCKNGYTSAACDRCNKNFYVNSKDGKLICSKCDTSCDGCNGSGPSDCESCKEGWIMVDKICVDINECLDNNLCNSDEYCQNKNGSYACKKCHENCETCFDFGAGKCLQCKKGFEHWKDSCIEVKSKQKLQREMIHRILLYVCFIIVSIILFKISKKLASIAIVFIALYITASEYTLLDTQRGGLLNIQSLFE